MQPFHKRPAFGHSVPAPVVVEQHGETAWAAFELELQRHDRQFADTRPADEVPAPSRLASSLVQLRPAPPPPAPYDLDLAQALALARKGNRVCPKAPAWNAVHEMLCDVAASRGLKPPPAPIGPEAWGSTSKMAKRMAFRDHVEWADRYRELPRLYALMESFDEASWVHW